MPRTTNKLRDKEIVEKYNDLKWTFEKIGKHYKMSKQAAIKAYYRFTNNTYPVKK